MSLLAALQLNTTKGSRTLEIRRRHAEGELVRDLAQQFGITEQRISQIIFGRRD